MVLYYITDRTAFAGDEPARRRQLLDKIAEAARCGVECIQLREKDLSVRELEQLAREAINAVAHQLTTRHGQLATALLINSRTDVALATGADGVHLRSDDVPPHQIRQIWQRSAGQCREEKSGEEKCGAGVPFGFARGRLAHENSRRRPLVAISCHSPAEVAQAAANAADFAVFAPVFEKKDAPGNRSAGLGALKQACRAAIPVLALGGITLQNAQSCLDAGAAGIAAIRLFQDNDIATVVEKLRGLIPSTSRSSSEPA